jgi:hypothetical protein
MRWAFPLILGLGLLVAIFGLALVIVAAQGQPYTAAMMSCGGEFRFTGQHMANFSSEDAAKQWADGQLAGGFDIAYIYRPQGTGMLSELLWIKSESNECYPNQYHDWSRPG